MRACVREQGRACVPAAVPQRHAAPGHAVSSACMRTPACPHTLPPSAPSQRGLTGVQATPAHTPCLHISDRLCAALRSVTGLDSPPSATVRAPSLSTSSSRRTCCTCCSISCAEACICAQARGCFKALWAPDLGPLVASTGPGGSHALHPLLSSNLGSCCGRAIPTQQHTFSSLNPSLTDDTRIGTLCIV